MIVKTGSVLFSFILLAAAVCVGVLSSGPGNRLLINWAEDILTPALKVDGLTGSLLSSLCARMVSYETATVSVLVEDACVEPELWTSIDFFTIQLQSLEAARVSIDTRPGSAGTDNPEISLPIDIAADELIIGELRVNGLSLQRINMAVNLSNSNLVVAGFIEYEAWRAGIVTSGTWDRFRVLMDVLNVQADATLDLQDELLPWTLSVVSPDLDLAPFAGRQISLADLDLSGSGNLDGYEFRTQAAVEDPEVNGRLRAAGTGDWSGVALTELEIGDARLVAFPVVIQQLSGRGQLSWAEVFNAQFQDIDAQAQLFDEPVAVVVDELSLDAESLAVRAASMRLVDGPGGAVALDGRLDFTGPLTFEVMAERLPLHLADERLQGNLDLEATVAGDLSSPRVTARLAADSLFWEEQAVGSAQGDLQGSLEKGAVSLRVTSTQGELVTGLDYSLGEEDLTLSIHQAMLAYSPQDASAELLAPVTVVVGDGAIRFEEACFELRSGLVDAMPGQLCGAMDYPDGGVTAHLAPWRTPLIPLPDGKVSIAGVAGMEIDVKAFAPLTGGMAFQLSELSAHHPDLDTLTLGELTAKVSLLDGVVGVEFVTPQDDSQELLLNGTLTSTLSEPLLDSGLSGSIYMELDGIWVAESLLPMDLTYELDSVRGVMGVNATLSGTLATPILDGTLKLSDAGWRVLALNADFSEFALDATLEGSEAIAFSSSGAIGEGRLDVTGSLTGMSGSEPRLSSEFKLERATVLDLPDYRAVVDGRFSLGVGREDLSLEGDLVLTEADILIADLPATATRASTDVVFVDEALSADVQQLRTTDMRLRLGDDVHLEAFGLVARLSGNLRVQEAPGRLRAVTGNLSLHEGKFEAYGQELVVDRGRLTFSGQVDNPTVDLVASRTVNYQERDYRISLLITGTAQKLTTDVRSQPSLPEGDALALLLTGQTFSQISSSEQSNVNGAALSMGLLSATGVTQNLASALNLEEIIVDQDSSGNMEVGAAIRLNRDIYLRYTYGVFSRLGGVLLRYRFSRRFSVQAKTGDAHSIEVRYGVDD